MRRFGRFRGRPISLSPHEPFLPRTERSFARLDADSDGKMTMNEWKPKAEKRFLRLDDDKNGTVTTAEIDTWLKRGIDRRKERHAEPARPEQGRQCDA